MSEPRDDRIERERQLLRTLVDQQPWLAFAELDGPGDRWRLDIQGAGLARGGPELDQYQIADHHEIELQLPDSFPDSPPQLRVQTPIFHPNMAPDGRLTLSDIGMSWQSELTLDILIERTWDLIRGATFDLDNAINPAAARWYQTQSALQWPLDEHRISPERPLMNIVRYHRKRRRRRQPNWQSNRSAANVASQSEGIHFID